MYHSNRRRNKLSLGTHLSQNLVLDTELKFKDWSSRVPEKQYCCSPYVIVHIETEQHYHKQTNLYHYNIDTLGSSCEH